MKKYIICIMSLLLVCTFSRLSLAQGLATATLRANNYTVQLIAVDTIREANSYIARNGLKNAAIPLRVNQNGKTLYKVVYGDYSSRAQAESAIKGLPSQLKHLHPWVRQFRDFTH